MPGFEGLQSGFFKRWGGLLAIGGGVLILAFVFLSKKNAASTPSTTGTSTAPGTTPSGQPLVEYVPTTGDSYTNIDYSSGNTSTSYDNGNVASPVIGQPVPVPPVPTPVDIPLGVQKGIFVPPPRTNGTVPPQAPPGPNPPTHTTPPQPAPHSMPPTPPARPPVPVTPGRVYTVARGDTLTAIAAKFRVPWQVLYQHNKNVIDATSAQHGNPVPGGPWNNLFGGEVLNVPN